MGKSHVCVAMRSLRNIASPLNLGKFKSSRISLGMGCFAFDICDNHSNAFSLPGITTSCNGESHSAQACCAKAVSPGSSSTSNNLF